MRLLERINCPKCLKSFDIAELDVLASEIREVLINKINSAGGHLGSNLGIIEATIALHYVFDSPTDKIVFDVSHQSYTHKILTGRKDAFINPALFNTLSGYTTPSESIHDAFKVGHTSTSISLACGLAKGRDLLGEDYNVIAVIGDGSLSGGEAYEGLNNASCFKSNMIIVVNDNEMSIAPNQGALYDNLAKLRATNGTYELNFFKALGFDYLYVDNGNDINSLIKVFSKVKDINHPVIVHIHTKKGKGLLWAEENKELGHWEIGKFADRSNVTYQELTKNYLQKAILENPKLFVATAATPTALGLTQEFRDNLGERFVDVGICEEHLISLASGAAKSGCVPVITISSSFFQRTYDQVQQDLCMNHNHVVILLYNAKIAGGDATHNGAYDIAFTMSIPGIECFAPSYKEEYFDLLDYAINEAEGPVIIRVPCTVKSNQNYTKNSLFKKIYQKQNNILILGLGNFYDLANEVSESLKEEGILVDVVNPIKYSSLSSEDIDILKEYTMVVTLEDGIVSGGFGANVAANLSKYNVKVLCYGQDKDFNDLVSLNEIYEKCHLKKELITKDILKYL